MFKIVDADLLSNLQNSHYKYSIFNEVQRHLLCSTNTYTLRNAAGKFPHLKHLLLTIKHAVIRKIAN